MSRGTIRKSQKSHKQKKKVWRAMISHMLKGRGKRMYECKEGRERKRSFHCELPVNYMSTGDSIMPVRIEALNLFFQGYSIRKIDGYFKACFFLSMIDMTVRSAEFPDRIRKQQMNTENTMD